MIARTFFLSLVLLGVLSAPTLAQQQEPPRLSTEGRFLYADDDDWDWASPIPSHQSCRLNVYGRMPWSALDWMEANLDEVRGVLLGTPPAVGDYLTMADLNRVRNAGPKRSYEQVAHTATIFRDLLQEKRPPNLIIVMQDVGNGKPPISPAEAEAALTFVKRGGRLLVLDDWQYYRELVGPFLDPRHFPKLVRAPAAVHKPLAKIDPWLAEAGTTARQLHLEAELRTISRNGQQQPGLALLITLPLPKKTKG